MNFILIKDVNNNNVVVNLDMICLIMPIEDAEYKISFANEDYIYVKKQEYNELINLMRGLK